MSTMLNFKYGLHGSLPAYDANNVGTIYVTTDEQAMYVDLPAGRIRVSQLITLGNITEWESLTPPYSTEAFYYIADANALLKYDGVNEKWVQINSTKAISDALETLESALNGKITTINERLDGHDTKIGTLESNVSDLQTELEEVSGLASSNKARLDADEKDIADLQNDLAAEIATRTANDTQQNADIATLKSGLAAEITRSTDAEKALQEAIDAEAQKARAAEEANAAAIAAAQTAIGDEVTSRENAVKDLQGQITSNDTDISNLQTKLDDEISNRTAAEEAIGKRIDDNEAAIANNGAAISQEVEDRKSEVTRLEGLINADSEGLTNLEKALADETKARTDADTALDSKISTNAEAIAKNATAIETNKQSIANNATAIAGNTANITANTTAIKTNADNITKESEARAAADADLQSQIDAEVEAREDAIKELTDTVTSNMQTADAMKFMGTVSSAADLLGKETGAEIGHTYKAVAEFKDDEVVTINFANSDKKVYIGDLLIASGTEVNGVISGDVIWLHVPSGYTADYNPEMSVEKSTDNKATINLTSGAAAANGDLGSVTLSAASDSSITITSDGVGVVVGMSWGTF